MIIYFNCNKLIILQFSVIKSLIFEQYYKNMIWEFNDFFIVNRMESIIDFWRRWNYLSTLKYRCGKNSVQSKEVVVCDICKKESYAKYYSKVLFDIGIPQHSRNKRLTKEEIKAKQEYEDTFNVSDDIKKIFKCSIWEQLTDLDKNLQCNSWLKTYWFNWLIWELLDSSKCPFWYKNINKNDLQVNKEWKKIAKCFI